MGLFVFFFASGPIVRGEEETLCSLAREALKEAARLRGLAPRQEVPCIVQRRAEVEAFIRDLVAKKYPPQKLALEGRLYRALGLIPEGFDYENGLIEAYVGQIGGYYDPEKKRFIIVDSIPERLGRGVSVHELTHALQDQYYDLDTFLDPAMESGDELLARAAVAEGDANLVMQAALRSEKVGADQLKGEIAAQEEMSGPELPEALQRLLLFPYDGGLRFVEAVQRSGGFKAREALFARPPRSTREILHPEEFLAGTAPFEVPTVADVMSSESKSEVLYTDTIGEFGISMILESQLSDSQKVRESSRGWRGDRAVIVHNKDGVSRVIWLSRWETPKDATEFSRAYEESLRKRHRGASPKGGAPKITVKDRDVWVALTLGK